MHSLKATHSVKLERIFLLFVCTFVAVLLLTNVIVTKHFNLGPFVLTAGAITYPFTFSLLDIISEIYGPHKARIAVWMGLIGSLFMTVVLQLVMRLPPYVEAPVDHATFQLLFGFTPGIVLGSMTAYLAAQFIDIYLFDWARRFTNNKHLWFRNNISTLVSQFVDTMLFGLVAWVVWPFFVPNESVAPLPWAAWYWITINEYAFKVVFTILNTPLVYAGVYTARYLGKE